MTIQDLLSNDWINLISAIVMLASAVAAVTPTPREDSVWGRIYKIIDFLAVNFGRAKDKNPATEDKVSPEETDAKPE